MRSVAALGPSLILTLGVACSEGDYTLEREGGPFPAPPGVDPPLGGSGGSGAGAAAVTGGAGEALVPFCDALTVVRNKCQRCHSDPTQNAAPVPFVTYEDFQVLYSECGMRWWQRAQYVVDIDYMPYVTLNDPPTSLMPPVEPLTPDEKTTLMTWFEQGALPEGGTDCPE